MNQQNKEDTILEFNEKGNFYDRQGDLKETIQEYTKGIELCQEA